MGAMRPHCCLWRQNEEHTDLQQWWHDSVPLTASVAFRFVDTFVVAAAFILDFFAVFFVAVFFPFFPLFPFFPFASFASFVSFSSFVSFAPFASFASFVSFLAFAFAFVFFFFFLPLFSSPYPSLRVFGCGSSPPPPPPPPQTSP